MNKISILSIFILLLTISCQSKKEEAAIETSAEVADMHNAKNSLDYLGTYKGTLPCADCEGIEVVITLNKDETYVKTATYLGKNTKPYNELGDFTWSEDGNVLSLEGIDTDPIEYFVEENKLVQLDQNGNRIEGDRAKNYELIKE